MSILTWNKTQNCNSYEIKPHQSYSKLDDRLKQIQYASVNILGAAADSIFFNHTFETAPNPNEPTQK